MRGFIFGDLATIVVAAACGYAALRTVPFRPITWKLMVTGENYAAKAAPAGLAGAA